MHISSLVKLADEALEQSESAGTHLLKIESGNALACSLDSWNVFVLFKLRS